MFESPEDDLLSSVLSAYQLRAGVYANPRLCGVWQMGTSGHRRAAFHVVGEGRCWLHLRDAPPQPLDGGDLVVCLPDADDGPFTTLVCGYFEFMAGDKNPILDALPEVIVVRGSSGSPHLGVIGRLLLEEADTADPGSRTVLDKLADTLFVMVVRHYINQATDRQGVLAALADTRLRRALAAMHREPARAWTLESLAQVAGMSRAGFAQRFADLVGSTPIEYLTRWRMTQAELLLRNPQVSVAGAAERVGYETEAAFRKAFKRIHGIGPGALRRWFRDRVGGGR
jgi:AraC-like DNA-binding protein